MGLSNTESKMVRMTYCRVGGARRYNPIVSGNTYFRQNSVKPLLSWIGIRKLFETMYLGDSAWVNDVSMSNFKNESDKLEGDECMLCEH